MAVLWIFLLIHITAAFRGTLYTLCRNSDLYEMLDTIVNYESRFNSKFHYDWVFLNDEPFSEEFKTFVSSYVSGEAHFGLVDPENWSIPQEVDRSIMHSKINETLNDPDGAYPYADSISYRNMCRFESGFFYKHPLLLNYDYFWRVEPGVSLLCDINYDIFKFMVDKGYDYGFTISTIEYPKTIQSLFPALKQALTDQGKLDLITSSDNYSQFIVDSQKLQYNLCHFWTNFEIGNLNLLRSPEYDSLFQALDSHSSKGFYYERWGDAPVRTLILSLILDRGRINHFNDIGYTHEPYSQCPNDPMLRLENRCACNPTYDITNKWYSCTTWFNRLTL